MNNVDEIKRTEGAITNGDFSAVTSEEAWGLATSVDLRKCDPELIRSAEAIKDFTIRLVNLLKMKAFGECHVVHFGQDERVAGYSMFQFIETSAISGHFANASNSVYLDVFSCKKYDPQVVAEFAKEFFRAESYSINVVNRY